MTRSPLFNLTHLHEDDAAALRARAVDLPFQPGEVLVHQGDHLDALQVITAGHAAVQKAGGGAEGGRVDVSVLGAGDLIGEMSFVTGETASATVSAITGGRVLRLPHRALLDLMIERPDLGQRLYRSLAASLAGRLRVTTARLPALMIESVAQVRPHHSTLTGRLLGRGLGGDRDYEAQVPFSLRQALGTFKDGMLALDKHLAQRRGAEAPGDSLSAWTETRASAAHDTGQLCDGLVTALTAAVQGLPEGRRADGYGGHVLREAFPLLMRSRLADRMFHKPRGFLGDYYTLELIYDHQPAGDGRLGPLIDGWLLRRPFFRALRGQRVLLRDLLRKRFQQVGADALGSDDSFRVLSLGSGAGRELFDFFAALGDARLWRSVRAACLDLDIEALAYSNHLAHSLGLADRVQWTQANLFDLGPGRALFRPAAQDVIYAAGIFDSLKDEQAVELLDWVHRHLQPGGLCVIGHVAPSCPDRALLDHLLDWRLLYRQPDELLSLIKRSGFRSEGAVMWPPDQAPIDEQRSLYLILVERAG